MIDKCFNHDPKINLIIFMISTKIENVSKTTTHATSVSTWSWTSRAEHMDCLPWSQAEHLDCLPWSTDDSETADTDVLTDPASPAQ